VKWQALSVCTVLLAHTIHVLWVGFTDGGS